MKIIRSSIKTKLQLSFLTFILLSTVSGILSYGFLSTIVAHEEVKSKVDQLVSLFAEARKQEKDFILYERKGLSFLEKGRCESLQRHSQTLREMKETIRSIVAGGESDINEQVSGEIQTIKLALDGYEWAFAQLVRSYKVRGFKDHGMEGAMRGVIHKLQECESKEEQWFALMLRRHEKDFFIRQDIKYIETLHKRAREFTDFVQHSDLPHMSPAYKVRTIAAIKNYVKHFNRIAAIEKEIGLTKNEGLMGTLTSQAELTEPLLHNIQQLIYEENQKLAGSSLLILLVTGTIMVVCGICFSFLLARKISNPIIQLSRVVSTASLGNDTTIRSLESIKGSDELGKLVESFKNMFREISLKVQEISEKNIVLQQAALLEKERKWFTEGISLFEGVMAKQTSDLGQLCDEFLLNLVKYTDSSQAALFLKVEEGGETVMSMQSCYAGDKKRFINNSVAIGEGLIGAVWQEKEAFYMNDIPESYAKIRSGLGQAKPTAVFITPAILNGEVEAVVEIGTFRELSGNEQEFVKQVCKGLANAVSRVRMQERTQSLLMQANSLTEDLQHNKDLMSQRLEKLNTAKEELERHNKGMQEKVESLQNSLSVVSKLLSFNYKGVLITDEHFNLVYGNGYWQPLMAEGEQQEPVKIGNLLNLSDKDVNTALRQQHQLLLNHLDKKKLRTDSGEEVSLTDVKVEEYRIEQKVFYSILAN